MAYSYKKQWKSAPLIVKAARIIREWSDFQKDIFKEIAIGTGNTHVAALAGTGKTASIVEGFYHIPNGKSILMCAFNKSTQVELSTRAPASVTVKTTHALGYAAIRKAFPKIGAPDKFKLEGFIIAELGENEDTYELRNNLAKCITLCKGCLIETPEGVDSIIDQYDIDFGNEKREYFVALTLKVMMATAKDTSRVDFDDMIWFPNIKNLPLEIYDFVFIDEAQDLNLAQINLALNSRAPGGRIISVGDVNQSIYGFRGADSNAIPNIIERMQSKVLPLSVTYRCAKSIVALAQELVPELQASDNAVEGSVQEVSTSFMEQNVKPGDFILSRVNAPLIKWCLTLLKNGIPANIQGRDMGKNLTSLIKKSKANDVNEFLEWLNKYQEIEISRLLKAKRDTTIVQDKVECLQSLCEGTNSIKDVKNNIDRLFKDGDDKDRVILSSTHKAKGLERDNVFMLTGTYKPGANQEESNLYYVAITRAKQNLYLVTGK